jgi:hypothetical protein
VRPHGPKKQYNAPNHSRRGFLIAGGAVIAGLSLRNAQLSQPRDEESSSRVKVREIMERYGSELGRAQLES